MKIEVLGNVQDGGVPHLGCECSVCTKAHEDCSKTKYVTSLMLRENNTEDSMRYLIEASPDIRYQIKAEYIDGVFVPHSGLGHITGLLYFGHEGPDANGLQVYCSESVENFLMKNDPYRYLVDRENIETKTLEDGEEMDIQGAEIETRYFEHAALNSRTTGYIIRGEEKTLFYISDIDEIDDEIKELIEDSDIAIIDGTFYSEEEIDRYEEVPHPTIKHMLTELDSAGTEIYFIHMNHTNPVLRENSDERQEVEKEEFHIAEEGDIFEI